MKKIFTSFILLVFVAGCRKEYNTREDYLSRPANLHPGKQVRDYFDLLCRISQTTPGFFPPQVARAYGYIGIAVYEAVAPGIGGAESLAGQLNGLSKADMPKPAPMLEYDYNIAAGAAIAATMRNMFERNLSSTNATVLDSMENASLREAAVGVENEVVHRSVKFGKDVAAAINRYAQTDGGHLSFLDPFQLPYSMPPDPSCWVPTGAVLTPVSPRWGENRPFITQSIANATQLPPIPFSTNASSAFYGEAMVVYNQVKNNTNEHRLIASYWADDPFNTCTPTGHTFNIMTQLLEENDATLEKTAVGYAKLGIAENDAFINCWKGKYKFLLIRPVSYIRQNIDPTFNTVIGTPPFPAYTSGHSSEIGAGSKIFIDLFTNGSGNYRFTDYSQLRYGFAARSYTNFNTMAEECADSRLYGGIHFPMDNSKGLEIGRSIGDNVNRLIRWPRNIR